MQEEAVLRREPRVQLKGLIHMAGYMTLKEYAEKNDLSLKTLHQVVGGWHNPGGVLRKRYARTLGVSLRDLNRLL